MTSGHLGTAPGACREVIKEIQESSSEWGTVGYNGHEKQGLDQTEYEEKLHQAVNQLPREPVQTVSMEVLIVQSLLR